MICMLYAEGARSRRATLYVGERTMGDEKFPVIIYERKLYCVCLLCRMLK